MGVCDEILKRGISPSCEDPLVPGLESDGVIMNRADVDFASAVFDTTRKNILKTLALSARKKAYKVYVPGKTPFTGTKTSLAQGTYRNTFTHDINIVVFDNDPDVCADIIDGLANGSYVLVLENKYKALQKTETPGDAAFQVYGWYQGLRANTIENDKYSEETDGGWLVALQETKVPKSGLFLYNTDYTTTKAQVETLTADPA
ncbi:hypothetical protein J8871_12315 [Bacteroides nordii]|jgi:hypothetical protein|uniref:hypothetical protein n=1 Tax=Bacteroides nordii TaxID=291645 RepID=UPI001F3FCD9E|nr:hypothetical protein [Bacteroides nordii]MCE8465884.1 hypothetical protein [Bacteroides nordii]UYU49794.1 hypothetical protein KQP55_04065 [Bacteroides nordii]